MMLRYGLHFLATACLWISLTAWGQAQGTPEHELAALRVPEGFELSLFASEPLITNPSAIDVDTQGRVWVAEIQWYRKAAKTPPADKIKVLEDTDGDGRADKVTVFAEGLFCPMSVCVAGDKVYVATSPDLWVYEDKDGDLKADGPPKKLLTGFGGYNHDHGAHSLTLGPDHKWWMAHGDRGFDVTGTDGSHIKFQWGAMLRGELDGSQLEMIAENFRNPYEMGVSSFGEAYCSDNDNDGNFSVRICWILEGGNYGWFGGPPFRKEELDTLVPPETPYRTGWHFRAHVPGYVPGTLVTGFGSPCGMCFYEGAAFGPKYKNAAWHCDAGPREVRVYRHTEEGFGKLATAENVVTSAGDNYFRPDDVCTHPDGSLLISDWYDGGVGGHAYNDPDRGRIFRLTPKNKELKRVGKPGPYDNIADAIEGLKNPNLATQFLARDYLLAQKEASLKSLLGLLEADDKNYRARALWLLDRMGERSHVIDALESEDPEFRALAVRILRRHGDEVGAEIWPLAGDSSPQVQREVLLAAGGSTSPAAFAALVKIARQYDPSDRYALETINIAAKDRGTELFTALTSDGQLNARWLPLLQKLNPEQTSKYVLDSLSQPDVQEKQALELIQMAGSFTTPETGELLLKIAGGTDRSVKLQAAALEQIRANLSGSWKSLSKNPALLSALEKGLQSPALQDVALAIVTEQGLKQLQPKLLAMISDKQTPTSAQVAAIRAAVALRLADLGQILSTKALSNQPQVAQSALEGLVMLQEATALRTLLAGQDLSASLKSKLVGDMVDSTGGALILLKLIDNNQLSGDLKKSVLAKATNHPDANVRTLFEKFIPEGERPQKLGAAIKPAEILALDGDPKRGQQIFFQSSAAQCKNCHMVHGQGANLGPDLSQIGKKYEVKTLLETILEPSKAIGPEYITYLMETDAGQIYAGFLEKKDDDEVVLRDAKNQLIRVPADEVVVIEKQEKSLMPELVLRDVSAQDAADLLSYLQTLTAAEQKVSKFRVLGPFDPKAANRLKAVEAQLADPDLTAKFPGLGGREMGWEVVSATTQGGVTAFDTVKYDNQQKLRSANVVHYFLVLADSAEAQEATLLIGSDDSNQVWVNGKLVNQFDGSRAIGYAQDQVKVQLRQGRNVIAIKVENGDGPGGVSLGIRSSGYLDISR